jgi:hypothetical protein
MKTNMIMLIILALTIISCNNSDSEVIVLPKNYKGYVVVIFNQKNGSSPKFENGKRLYEIPPSGILKTQFKGNYGLKDFPEFYFEKITLENKIASYTEFDKIPLNTLVGFIGANGTANKDLAGKKTIEYALFYVGDNNDITTAIEQAEKLDIAQLAE